MNETLIELIVAGLGIGYMSWVVAYGRIARSIRDRIGQRSFLGQLIHCPVCSAFWLSVVFILPTSLPIYAVPAEAFLGAVSALILNKLVDSVKE